MIALYVIYHSDSIICHLYFCYKARRNSAEMQQNAALHRCGVVVERDLRAHRILKREDT